VPTGRRHRGRSAASGAIVHARATRDAYPPRSSLWVASVAGGKRVRITRSHPDVYPLWDPPHVLVRHAFSPDWNR
jgi:hypothetical protein